MFLMPFKEKLVKKLEEIAGDFLDRGRREGLLAAMKSRETGWIVWKSEVQGLLKNLNYSDYLKFRTFLFLLEKSSDEDNVKRMEEFLIERIEFYKHHDFKKDEEFEKKAEETREHFSDKFFRILISRSFLGILVLGTALFFIGWYYLDRPGAIEFSEKILKLFLRATGG